MATQTTTTSVATTTPMTIVTSNTSSGIAAAAVVIFNWLLAHLENNWVMPAEVAAALQFLLTYAVGEWVVASKNKQMLKHHETVQRVLNAPDPRDPDPGPPLSSTVAQQTTTIKEPVAAPAAPVVPPAAAPVAPPPKAPGT